MLIFRIKISITAPAGSSRLSSPSSFLETPFFVTQNVLYIKHHAHHSGQKKGIVTMSYIRLIFIIICTSITLRNAANYDNGHFYRATNLFYEPRLEHDSLTSFQVTLGGGSTEHSRDGTGQTVPLFDLYGLNAMQPLGIGVPNKNMQNQNDLILIQLANLPSNNCFGMLSIDGDFSILESNILVSQNFTHGFFCQAHLPVRSMKVSHINFVDVSPGVSRCHPFNGQCPNSSTPIWQTFLNSFGSILSQYDISTEPFNKTGIGDFTFLLGWTINYQETEILDYIDATIRCGLLAPTSPQTNINDLFAIPFGYDGHWGFPLGFDLAIGAYEWVTIGTHLDAIVFANTTHDVRMKTAADQRGIIKLAQGKAEIQRGILWNGSMYFKADHIARGISFMLGYSYTKQNNTVLTPCDIAIFDPYVVNTDQMLKEWHMHVFHCSLEYDFTCNESWIGSHIGLFYNHEIGGEHIFKTDMVGGQFGINVAWDF